MRDLIAGEVLNILRSDETDALGLPGVRRRRRALAMPHGDSTDMKVEVEWCTMGGRASSRVGRVERLAPRLLG